MTCRMNHNVIHVDGFFKRLSDIKMLMNCINLINDSSIKIVINESFGLPSMIIGQLIKLIDEGIKVSLEVKEQKLYDSLENLNLIETLNVKKI